MIQHHHIDLGTVLRGTVCELYSNLVTRPTGAAVRGEIERAIAEMGGRTVTVIDFSQVTILDYSCADEIVAKLMIRYGGAPDGVHVNDDPFDVGEVGYFVFRGLGEHHLDAVEAVLERHALAIVAVLDGVPTLVGDVEAEERMVWNRLAQLGHARATTVARTLGAPLDVVIELLESLTARRLVVRVGDEYAALGALGPAPEAAA